MLSIVIRAVSMDLPIFEVLPTHATSLQPLMALGLELRSGTASYPGACAPQNLGHASGLVRKSELLLYHALSPLFPVIFIHSFRIITQMLALCLSLKFSLCRGLPLAFLRSMILMFSSKKNPITLTPLKWSMSEPALCVSPGMDKFSSQAPCCAAGSLFTLNPFDHGSVY